MVLSSRIMTRLSERTPSVFQRSEYIRALCASVGRGWAETTRASFRGRKVVEPERSCDPAWRGRESGLGGSCPRPNLRSGCGLLEQVLEPCAVARELAFQGATQERLGEAQGAGRLAMGAEAHEGATLGRLER